MELNTQYGNYTVTQTFGKNAAMYAKFGMQGHNGVDIKGINTPYVNVLKAGQYVESGYQEKGYGNYIKIRDENGYVWTYAHFKHAITLRGTIEKWDRIGEIGNTGYSTGPHCHIGIKPPNPDQRNGFLGSIDPMPFILQAINEDDMTQEERDMLHKVSRFVDELSKGVDKFRQRETDGALFLDAALVDDKTAEELKGTVYADTTALAALLRAAGVQQISQEESKKDKYVKVLSARDNA